MYPDIKTNCHHNLNHSKNWFFGVHLGVALSNYVKIFVCQISTGIKKKTKTGSLAWANQKIDFGGKPAAGTPRLCQSIYISNISWYQKKKKLAPKLKPFQK